MMNTSLPCVNCITLSMCRGYASKIESEILYHIEECPTWKPHDTLSYIDSNLIVALFHKCSILEQWLRRPKRDIENYICLATTDLIIPRKALGVIKYMNHFLWELYVSDKKTINDIFALMIKRKENE